MNSEEKKSILLTIRLVRSFNPPNVRNLVLKHVDVDLKVADLKNIIRNELKTSNLPPPFKTFHYDTLKIEHIPFKAKSIDPVINCWNDETLVLGEEQEISSLVNETEISYFVWNDYLEYKKSKGV